MRYIVRQVSTVYISHSTSRYLHCHHVFSLRNSQFVNTYRTVTVTGSSQARTAADVMRQTRSGDSARCLAKPALSPFQRTAPGCLRHAPALFGFQSCLVLLLLNTFSPPFFPRTFSSSLKILTPPFSQLWMNTFKKCHRSPHLLAATTDIWCPV
jgi:hypothetical protein